MFIAGLASIEIFATGGIGGVHRGAEETFDISADLVELSRTRVAVVCAGAKSILDIGKTLEFLETRESRSSATAPTSFRPSTPARPASSSNIAAMDSTTSPA